MRILSDTCLNKKANADAKYFVYEMAAKCGLVKENAALARDRDQGTLKLAALLPFEITTSGGATVKRHGGYYPMPKKHFKPVN